MDEIGREDRDIPNLLKFKPVRMKPIKGFAFGYTQRIVLLDLLVDESSEDTQFLLNFVDAIQNYLPPHHNYKTALKESNTTSEFKCLEIFSVVIAAFQEGAGGIVAEKAKVIAVNRNEDGFATVRMALPTINPSLCINATGQIFKFLMSATERDLLKDQKWLSESCNVILNNLTRYAPKGTNNKHFISAAISKKIPFIFLPQNNIQFGYGKGARLFNSSTTDETSGIAMHLAKDKRASNIFLKRAGFPVASQLTVKSLDEALNAANQIGYPVVLKPIDRDLGQGVYSRVASATQLKSYFSKASKISKNLVIENHFPGENYRVNVVRDKVVRVREQMGAHVIGDGLSTITQLIGIENDNPRRGSSRFFDLKPIPINDNLIEVLSTQELTTESIPSKDQRVWLAHHTNTTHGGVAKDVTEMIHPDNIDLCVRATALFGLDISGVDLIISDISKSHHQVGCIICEMNAMPQIMRTAPFIHDLILNDYVHEECFITVSVVSPSDTQNADKIEHLILDRSLSNIKIHISIDELYKNGLPVMYMHDLQFSKSLTEEQAVRVKRDFSTYLRRKN